VLAKSPLHLVRTYKLALNPFQGQLSIYLDRSTQVAIWVWFYFFTIYLEREVKDLEIQFLEL
jgi:hypothetical protein